MQKEIWKDIIGYEGLYMVSNFGRVKRLETTVEYRPRSQGGVRVDYLPEMIIQPFEGKFKNYKCWRIRLRKDGEQKNYQVHRLVAEAFIPNPDNKPWINHLDSNSKNNIWTNLEWCTPKENSQHASKKGRFGNKTDMEISQYDSKGNWIKDFKNQIEASEVTKIDKNSISLCVSGTYKQTKGYIFIKKGEDISKRTSKRKKGIPMPILQFDLNNNLICEYDSISEAVRSTNLTQYKIINAIERQTTKTNYIWKYKNI